MTQPIIKFTRGVPPPESFPTAQLAECTASALAEYGDLIQQYGPAYGYKPLRQWIANENQASLEQVLVGQGSLQLFDLAARLLVQPGDAVYVELPSYDRAVTTLKRAQGTVTGIPLLADGPDIDFLKARLQAGERPKLFYLIPDFQNPSGSLMPAHKRAAIAALAKEYGFWIVEDSPYRLLRYRGQDLPSIYSFAPEQVMLMSSYSKTICPGVRVGYMVVPQTLVKPLVKMAEDTYITPSYVNQAAVYEFLRRGLFTGNLARLKTLYLERLEKMLGSLDAHMQGLGDWTRPDGGFFISLNVARPCTSRRLMEEAARGGLELSDGRGFFADGGGDNFLRLPFCGLSPEEIEQGTAALANVIRKL